MLALEASLATKILRRFSLGFEILALILLLLKSQILIKKIEIKACSFQLVSRSLVGYIIRLLGEEVFCCLAFLAFSFSWALEFGFSVSPICEVLTGGSRVCLGSIFILMLLLDKFLFWSVVKKPLNISLPSKSSKEVEFFLLISSKIRRSLTWMTLSCNCINTQ